MNRDDLFDKFLQRSLNRVEAEELKALLKNDPSAGRALVEHVNEASLLVRVGSQLQAVPAIGEERIELHSANPLPSRSRWGLPGWGWGALAACLAVFAAAGFLLLRAAPAFRATIASLSGEATILRGTQSIPAEIGFPLQQGDIVETMAKSRVVVVFDGEATRAELQSEAQARFTVSRKGKRLELTKGALEATIAPQKNSPPMTLATLHAEVKAAGTRFLLASEISSTRLEVSEGAVEFKRHPDGQSLLVKNGFTATASPNTEFCARPFLPDAWSSGDIGAVRLRGQALFDGSAFRVRGAGQDTCCQKDQLHFVYQILEGDGEIRARVREIEFADPESKATLMIRGNLKAASRQVSVGVTASGGLEVEFRTSGESRIERAGWSAAPSWLRLLRRGREITAYKSADGTNWTQVGTQSMHLTGRAYVGLGVTSFNHAALSTSLFDQVTVERLNPLQME
jgi:ferric-dicitrate binding protein FerR (iron transport regulator)